MAPSPGAPRMAARSYGTFWQGDGGADVEPVFLYRRGLRLGLRRIDPDGGGEVGDRGPIVRRRKQRPDTADIFRRQRIERDVDGLVAHLATGEFGIGLQRLHR